MTNKAYNFVINGVTHTVLNKDKAYLFELSHKEEITSKFESILEIDFELDDYFLEVIEHYCDYIQVQDIYGNKDYLDVVLLENDYYEGPDFVNHGLMFGYLMYKGQKVNLDLLSDDFNESFDEDLINEKANENFRTLYL